MNHLHEEEGPAATASPSLRTNPNPPSTLQRPSFRSHDTGLFDLAGYVAYYQPQNEPRWPEVAPFVRDVVAQSGARTYVHAERLMRVMTMISIWALDHGLPLDVEVVLHPDRIGHFTATYLAKSKSVTTYRHDLLTLGRKITKKAPYRPKPGLSRPGPAGPYTDDELARYVRIVTSQGSEERVQVGLALVLLGVGAGLDGRWSPRVRTADVNRLENGYLVVDVTGPHARRVPVDDRYAARLEAFADQVHTEYLVGSAAQASRRASSLVGLLDFPADVPKINARRLRTTWLRNQILDGMPLPYLLEVAALETTCKLSAVLPYVGDRMPQAPWTAGGVR